MSSSVLVPQDHEKVIRIMIINGLLNIVMFKNGIMGEMLGKNQLCTRRLLVGFSFDFLETWHEYSLGQCLP